jgi:hypothetical protein
MTACTERHFRTLTARAAGEGRKGMAKEMGIQP